MVEEINYAPYVVIAIAIFIILFVYIPYFKNRRERISILDLSTEPVRIRRLGFIMNEIKPKTRILNIKKGVASKTEKYKIPKSLWDIKVDFKNVIDSKIGFLIIGSIGEKNRDNTINLDCTLTNDQMGMIIKAQDTLNALNDLLDFTTSSKMEEFKNVSQASILVMKKMEEIKNQIITGMRYQGQGLTDASVVFKEMYGLDDNEVNYERIEELIEQGLLKEAMDKASSGNGATKKKLFNINIGGKE